MAITIKNGAKVLYQWERGVALTVTAPCDVLRVSREEEQRSVDLFPTWSGNTGTVLIPDRMLTESGYLRAARIDKGDGEERVMERVRIIIRAAQKPENDASSQREIRDWEELRIRMAALERAAREGKFDGEDGTTPHIGENGNWYIGDTDTGVNAKGDDGLTPHIGENGNWYIGGVDTGVKAKGDDGIAPHIGENGNWFIGETDTGVKAKGDDGLTPHIGENGNWYIGGVDTGVKAMGDNGITPHIGENGNWYIGEEDTGVKARSENVSEYVQDLVTNGVYVADDPDAMLGKPVDGTETNNPIRFRAEPGVLYVNGVRKKVGAAAINMKSPETERIRAFGYRLYEETGVIKQIVWDVEITTDADGNEIITAIGYDPDFISAVLPVREGGIYDILIYTVTVPAGATQATQDMIRDLRGDERYCGFVRSKLDESVGIDATLTVPGAAADAAAVGAEHNDIRLLISRLTTRLNALADSDDTTLDQLSEIVEYIKANKTLIDSITTSKVNVADIIDNLTTSVSNKPLSAKMGVELKKLIDAIEIPTGKIETDDTLTVPGSAADAAVVGEKISELSETIAEQNILSPDDLEGTDTEKLQACLDALATTGGVISINRPYVLTGDLRVPNESDYTRRTYIRGTGKNASIEFGTHSIAGYEETKKSYGNIVLEGLLLTGTGTMINADNLMRIFVENCTIRSFEYVVYTNDYIQTLYLLNSEIRGITGCIVKSLSETTEEDDGYAFDVKIANCLTEWNKGLFDVKRAQGCSITNNCIEGYNGTPITVREGAAGLNISANYFELNGTNIDLSAATELMMNISDNMFSENDGTDVICLPAKNPAGYLSICGNWARPSSTFISVPDNATLLSNVYVFGNTGLVKDTQNALRSMVPGDIRYALEQAQKVDDLPNNETLINNVAEVVKAEVPLVKTAEQPSFVNSVDEMTDTSKVYVMSDMYLYAYKKTTVNQVYTFTADEFIAGEVNANGASTDSGVKTRIFTADLIDLSKGTVGVNCPDPYQYIVYYFSSNSDGDYLGKTSFKTGSIDNVLNDTITSGTVNGATHCRVSLRDSTNTSANLSTRLNEFVTNITVNQTVPTEAYAWVNTGFLYNQPADYENRIVSLEKLVAELQEKLS